MDNQQAILKSEEEETTSVENHWEKNKERGTKRSTKQGCYREERKREEYRKPGY